MATRNDETTNAAATYPQRAADIQKLLDLIKGELAVHAVQAAGAPRDWGYAGDLGKVRGDLIDAYRFISQKDFTINPHGKD